VYTPQFICLLVLVVATVLFTSLYFVTNMKYLDLDLGFVRSRKSARFFQKLCVSHPVSAANSRPDFSAGLGIKCGQLRKC
jgi:hypothetical protein